MIVTRARRYGGPFVLTPEAGLETPLFHVVMLKSYGLIAAIRYGIALATGRLHRLHDVDVRSGTTVRVNGWSGDPVQMDGDIGSAAPIDISMDSRDVPFLVPEGLGHAGR